MATGTQGEDAGVGIFAADKYHQSDEDATKNAKDDITRQGMEIAQTDKPLTEEARNPHAITGVKPHPSTATNVNPAISKTLDEISRPAATDADFLAWVEKNQGPPEQVDYITEHCRRDSIETVEAMRVRGGSFSSAGLPRSRKGSSGSAAGYEHDHGHHHRGPVKTVLHALHLDMKDRKKEKAAHKEATAIAMEQEDMDKWANKLKERHERKLKKHPPKVNEDDASDSDHSSGDASDITQPRQVGTVSLDLLNPEFLEKKRREEEILSSGGDLTSLGSNIDSASTVSVSSERISQMIASDRARTEAGLGPAEGEIDQLSKDFKLTFHTADSFERLDKAAAKAWVPADEPPNYGGRTGSEPTVPQATRLANDANRPTSDIYLAKPQSTTEDFEQDDRHANLAAQGLSTGVRRDTVPANEPPVNGAHPTNTLPNSANMLPDSASVLANPTNMLPNFEDRIANLAAAHRRNIMDRAKVDHSALLSTQL